MSHRLLCTCAALVSACWLGLGGACAENRIALVIGNSTYRTVSALPNPANDAKAMAELLRSAGFDVVAAPDLTQADMRQVISEFADEAGKKGPDTVVLVFYAGHGLQVDGENFLVPVDIHLASEADVPLQALRLSDLMNALAALPSKTRIVMLDACRNNPFSAVNKTTGHGLAIVDAPAGTIVSYSTSPGAEAEDGAGADSPYTTALLSVAKEPGLPIEQAFKKVRLSVHQATDGRQTPWESSSLGNDFFFFPGGSGGTPAASKPLAAPAAAQTIEVWRKQIQGKPPRDAYEIVLSADTVEAYGAFVALYGSSPFGSRARGLLDRRQEMVAWYVAVTVNTVAAYQAFLASFPNSDLAVTAKRLMERSRSRSLLASTTPVIPANFTPSTSACQCSTPPANQPAPPAPARRANAAPPPPPPPPPSPSRARGGPPPTVIVGHGPPGPPGPPGPSGPPTRVGGPPDPGPAIATGIAIGIGAAALGGAFGRHGGDSPYRGPTTTGPMMGGPMRGCHNC